VFEEVIGCCLPLDRGMDAFLQSLRGSQGLVRSRLLDHALNARGDRRRAAHERLGSLLRCGDDLWLLEGMATEQGWEQAAALLACVRRQLEGLLRGRLDETAWLGDDTEATRTHRHAWQCTIEAIQQCLESP
jgi:hypothetical protein